MNTTGNTMLERFEKEEIRILRELIRSTEKATLLRKLKEVVEATSGEARQFTLALTEKIMGITDEEMWELFEQITSPSY